VALATPASTQCSEKAKTLKLWRERLVKVQAELEEAKASAAKKEFLFNSTNSCQPTAFSGFWKHYFEGELRKRAEAVWDARATVSKVAKYVTNLQAKLNLEEVCNSVITTLEGKQIYEGIVWEGPFKFDAFTFNVGNFNYLSYSSEY